LFVSDGHDFIHSVRTALNVWHVWRQNRVWIEGDCEHIVEVD
jgi:hypothetical protein